jgi:hypothetical protein
MTRRQRRKAQFAPSPPTPESTQVTLHEGTPPPGEKTGVPLAFAVPFGLVFAFALVIVVNA